jgi:hypothetical protein
LGASVHTRGKKKRPSRPFVQVFKDLLQSPAWRELTNASRVAYIHLLADQNGQPKTLRLTYSQADELMQRKTFTRALRQLEALGFIERTVAGGLFNQCSEYQLSGRWRERKG